MYAGMPGKIGWRCRQRMASEIAGTSTNDKVLLTETTGDQTGIGKFSAANDNIQPFCHQIGDAILKVDIQLDLGISFNKGRQDRHQEMMTDDMRNADAQASLRAFPAFDNACLRIFEIIDNALAAFVEG